MTKNIDETVKRLEENASLVRTHLPYASRAFVVELAGTPKSGKSTVVEAVRHFFKRQGFRVLVLTERAAVCPIPMKGHLYFNTWCATSMLAELLANVETETDIIIVDRGILDTLVWMTMQEERGELTPDEAAAISAFLLMKRWTSLIDLAIVMTVNPEEAIRRETDQRISSKPGSIMNQAILGVIYQSVKKCKQKYQSRFKLVELFDTTGDVQAPPAQRVRQSNAEIATKILTCLEEFLNPQVLVVDKKELLKLPHAKGCHFGGDAIELAIKCIADHGSYMSRSEAESNSEYVQISPCALISHSTKVFLFERQDGDPKSRLYGSRTLIRGCHAAKMEALETKKVLEDSLRNKLLSSLHLSRVFRMDALGYCWKPDDAKSNRHFGVVYDVMIDNEQAAADLQQKEFRKQRGHGFAGGFVEIADAKKRAAESELEIWSQLVLEHCSKFRE